MLSHARRPEIRRSGIVQATGKRLDLPAVKHLLSVQTASCQHMHVFETVPNRTSYGCRIGQGIETIKNIQQSIKRALTAVKGFTEYLQILVVGGSCGLTTEHLFLRCIFSRQVWSRNLHPVRHQVLVAASVIWACRLVVAVPEKDC